MTSNIDWPAQLPQELSQSGYQEGLASNIIRSQVDSGPEKRRKRFTAATRPLQGQMQMTRAQLNTLETFFNETVNYGANAFDFPKPGFEDGSTYCVAFRAPPNWINVGGDVYRVSLDFEIQP